MLLLTLVLCAECPFRILSECCLDFIDLLCQRKTFLGLIVTTNGQLSHDLQLTPKKQNPHIVSGMLIILELIKISSVEGFFKVFLVPF